MKTTERGNRMYDTRTNTTRSDAAGSFSVSTMSPINTQPKSWTTRFSVGTGNGDHSMLQRKKA